MPTTETSQPFYPVCPWTFASPECRPQQVSKSLRRRAAKPEVRISDRYPETGCAASRSGYRRDPEDSSHIPHGKPFQPPVKAGEQSHPSRSCQVCALHFPDRLWRKNQGAERTHLPSPNGGRTARRQPARRMSKLPPRGETETASNKCHRERTRIDQDMKSESLQGKAGGRS